MKKNIEDMKTAKGRITMITRQDIVSTPSGGRKGRPLRTTEQVPVTQTYKTEERSHIPTTPTIPRKRSGSRKPLSIIFLVVVFLGFAYLCMSFFQNARVVVYQKHQTFTLTNQAFTASQNQDDPLHFDIMIVSDTQYKDMVLTNSANVSVKAQGSIVIYNTYSTKPVSIGAHTYVADPSGKTYLTDKAVTIPGFTTDKTDKTKITPGQASVTISAFLPGDSYNGTPTDFTITSFKNTPKYTKIYAKATTPLTGGAQGLIYTLNADQQGMLDATATSTFKSSMLKKAVAQVPAGYILYNTALQFSYTSEGNTFSSPTPSAQVPMNGTVTAVILKKSDLALALVKHLLPDATDKEVSEIQLEDVENLSYALANTSQVIDKDTQSVGFTLTGDLHATWNPDIDTLRTNLTGALSSTTPSIFQSDPGIANATVRIFPPWQSHLPTDPSKIDIRIK